jgi:hypothetical protein
MVKELIINEMINFIYLITKNILKITKKKECNTMRGH